VAAREGTGKGRILVIDDDEIARQAISDLLHNGGYTVYPLASPIGATQVIATQGIVAAVIDLNMPVMSGDRFIALIRTWDRHRDGPAGRGAAAGRRRGHQGSDERTARLHCGLRAGS
jgi:CheY-like chemotaxis protein